LSILVGVTQRVDVSQTQERRDALDQNWLRFLDACGLQAVPLPNHPSAAGLFDRAGCGGLILSGGNDLCAYGGDAPERDANETRLVDLALSRDMPVLGVCRGMQFLLHGWGVPLTSVSGHVGKPHPVTGPLGTRLVNSYHRYGALHAGPGLSVLARSADGAIESIRHNRLPHLGIMWHPERENPFKDEDIALFRAHFGR
jgi:putative glutamine amidotransferase